MSWFGVQFPACRGQLPSELEAALVGFADPRPLAALGSTWSRGDYYWRIVELLWGSGTAKYFVRHPWAERMVEEACRSMYLAISGCASSGKSDFGAVWALVNWLAMPAATKVLVTSTGLKESRNRIWGKIEDYFLKASQALPGKLVSSVGQIRLEADGVTAPTAGIELVASDKSKEKEAVGKLIGIKAPRVIFIADELPELPESILSAAYSNLATNPYFQLIALGNFKSTLDAFGAFCEPAAGWGSISVESDEWPTKRGVCLRFDGLKSPNVLVGEDRWPIYGNRQLREHRLLGENTALFWRMCRSFLAPEGLVEFIYSESELLSGHAFDAPEWKGPRVRLAALDPAFTNEGDRPILVFGSLGETTSGQRILMLDRVVQLRDDARTSDPFDFQIARAFRDECEREGVKPENAAFDATGAGISFASIVTNEWSARPLAMKFGGAASDYSVSATENKPAHQVYGNRVSELWYQGREYVRAGQVRGVTKELAGELTARKYETRKGSEARIVVEPKREMKARLGISPDLGDAFLMMVELARLRHGWFPVGYGRRAGTREEEEISEWVRKVNDVYDERAFLVADTWER